MQGLEELQLDVDLKLPGYNNVLLLAKRSDGGEVI